MSLFDDLVSINNSLSATLQGINSLLPFEAETLKDAPPIIEVAIGSARQEGEESGYDIGYDVGYGNAASIIVSTSNEVIEKYTTPVEDWSELPSKIDEVYEAGKAAGGGGDDYYDTFWEVYQEGGNRMDYRYSFSGHGWTDETFKPKYDIRPTLANNMFNTSKMTDLKKSFTDAGVVADFSQCADFTHWISGCPSATFGEINTTAADSLQYLFSQRNYLVIIDKIIFRDDGSQTGFTTGFNELRELVEVRFEGKVGQSWSFNRSTKLSKASIQSIYAALSTAAGMSDNTITLPLVAVNKAFETSEGANDGSTSTEWQNLVSGTPWRTVLS